MDEREHDRAEYCRTFLRNWCRAGSDCSFRVVDGRARPRLVGEDGQEVVVVGREWLEANAIPVGYVAGDGKACGA